MYNTNLIRCDKKEVLQTIINYDQRNGQNSPGRLDFSKLPDFKNDSYKRWGLHCELVYYADNYSECMIHTESGTIHLVCQALSKMYPNEVIRCQYGFINDNHRQQPVVEYRNGNDIQVDIIETVPMADCELDSLPNCAKDIVKKRVEEIHKILNNGETIVFTMEIEGKKVIADISKDRVTFTLFEKAMQWKEIPTLPF